MSAPNVVLIVSDDHGPRARPAYYLAQLELMDAQIGLLLTRSWSESSPSSPPGTTPGAVKSIRKDSVRLRHTEHVRRALEFWPDYGQGPLWDDQGRAVDLDELGLPSALVERIRNWHGRYEEDRLPLDGPGDSGWLSEGVEVLSSIRLSLTDIRVVVTEPWWGEAESSGPRSPEGE